MENKLMKIESKELDNVVKNSGLAIQEGEEIKKSYIPFIAQLADIQEQSKKINFDNPVDIDEKIARELRLKTVKIRTGASDLKDERKRIFLLKGNLEQAAYNLIAASCKLTEETLTNVEKAREIAEKKRKEERRQKRVQTLSDFEFDFTFVDLLNMPDEQFDKLVLQLENEKAANIEAERKAEAERLAKIEEERIENERIRKENEKLQVEIKEKERLAEIERKKQQAILEKQRKEAEEKARVEAEKQAKIQAELRAKAEAEAKERARIEAELRAKAEAEAKALKEKQEAEAKAALAPDKEKLKSWINGLQVPSIELKQDKAKQIQTEIKSKFVSFQKWALSQIETI